MTRPAHFQKHVDDFLAAIRRVEAAYRYPVFYFVAFRREGKLAIIQASLQLNTSLSLTVPRFESANIVAGQYSLAELKLNIQGFIEALFSGSVSTPDGDLSYLMPDQGPPSPYYVPFHDYGLENQHRLNVLRFSSKSPLENVLPIELDWELRASPTPYESLQELVLAFRLGQLRRDQANVEIVAYNVAAVDFSSKVSGDKAWPIIRLAQGLDPHKVLLGYRIQEKGGVTARASVRGDALKWKIESDIQHATAEVTIPSAAVLHCFVSYDGLTQQFGWLVDPATVQNSRRAAFEAFDPQLEVLNEIVENQQGRYRSRDFEAVVSWLLWMLGFGVAHLGDTPKMQDAVDLIATTPSGHIALVECTVGLLKADKLSQLHDRVETVKRAVLASGNPQLRVLPIIVTSKTRTELASADIEKAERLGIVVYAREDVAEMITRARFVGNAEQLFTDAEGTATFALEKYTPRLI